MFVFHITSTPWTSTTHKNGCCSGVRVSPYSYVNQIMTFSFCTNRSLPEGVGRLWCSFLEQRQVCCQVDRIQQVSQQGHLFLQHNQGCFLRVPVCCVEAETWKALDSMNKDHREPARPAEWREGGYEDWDAQERVETQALDVLWVKWGLSNERSTPRTSALRTPSDTSFWQKLKTALANFVPTQLPIISAVFLCSRNPQPLFLDTVLHTRSSINIFKHTEPHWTRTPITYSSENGCHAIPSAPYVKSSLAGFHIY